MKGVTTVLLAAATALCVMSPSVATATVTVGSPLLSTGSTSSGCGSSGPCTFVPLALPASDGLVESPVDGAIVDWRLKGASTDPGYAIRVLRRDDGLQFTGGPSSPPVTPASGGVKTFPVALPIEAGDYIGLDVPADGRIGMFAAPGAGFGFFLPRLAEGASTTTSEFPYEPAFNAEVQPAPKITQVTPAAGLTTGGLTVEITGSSFADVRSVKFGDIQASSFSIASEDRLLAVSPPAPSARVVDIAVTTVAGESPRTSSALFEYVEPQVEAPIPSACVVPKLKGRTLASAKKRARRALCGIGSVKRSRRESQKVFRVVKQRPPAGGTYAAGKAIAITLR